MSFDGPENQLIPKPTVSLSTSSGDSVTLGSLLLFPSCCRWCRIQGPKNGPRILEMVVLYLYYPEHIMFGILIRYGIGPKCVDLRDAIYSSANLILSRVSRSCETAIGRIPPTVLQRTKTQTSFRHSFCTNCSSAEICICCLWIWNDMDLRPNNGC